jgi:hypothetical protein
MRRISAVGSLPESGSCESSRTVVSTSFGMRLDLIDLAGSASPGSAPRSVAFLEARRREFFS